MLENRLAGDAVWAALDTAGARGMQLLAMLLAARLLGPQRFGEVGVLMAVVVSVSAVVGDSMRFTAATQIGTALHRDAASCGSLLRAIGMTTVAVVTTCAALIVIAAGPLAAKLLDAPHLAPALRIAAALMWMECVGGVVAGTLQAMRKFRPMALAGIGAGLVLLLTVPLGAHFYGTLGVIAGLVAASTSGFIAKLWLLHREFDRRGLDLHTRPGARERDVLWRVGLPGVMNGLMFAPVNGIAMLMLVNSPSGYAEAGLLGVGNQWFAALLFLPGVAATVTLPWFAEAIARGNFDALKHAVTVAIRAVAWAVLPASALVAISSPWIMRLYGMDFSGGWPALSLLAIAATLASTLNMLSNLLAAAGRMGAVLMAQAAWSLVYLATAAMLLPWMAGSTAIAAALTAAHFARLVVATRAVVAMWKNPVSTVARPSMP